MQTPIIKDFKLLTKKQIDCLSAISENKNTLIIKGRQTGATMLLARYIGSKLLSGENLTIFYMSSSKITNDWFMEIVLDWLDNIGSSEEVLSHTSSKLIMQNGNKLECKKNVSKQFLGYDKIDVFVYDEIGFEKGNFNELQESLKLCNPSKTIYTYTAFDLDKIVTPCSPDIYEWLLTADFNRVRLNTIDGNFRY